MKTQLKKVLLTSTLLISSFFLIQETAQARFRVTHSGSPNSNEFFEFEINTKVLNTSLNPDEGLFENAIIGAKYTCAMMSSQSFCNDTGDVIFYKPANIKASILQPGEDGEVTFENGYKVKYEGQLETEKDGVFYLQDFQIGFQPKNNSPFNFGIVTSLDVLANELKNKNIGSSVLLGPVDFDSMGKLFCCGSGPLEYETVSVPEPNLGNSLIGIGTLGTYLLFKSTRKKKSSNQNSLKQTA